MFNGKIHLRDAEWHYSFNTKGTKESTEKLFSYFTLLRSLPGFRPRIWSGADFVMITCRLRVNTPRLCF